MVRVAATDVLLYNLRTIFTGRLYHVSVEKGLTALSQCHIYALEVQEPLNLIYPGIIIITTTTTTTTTTTVNSRFNGSIQRR